MKEYLKIDFRMRTFDLLYRDLEVLKERLRGARSSEEFWSICGAISELESLIEYLNNY